MAPPVATVFPPAFELDKGPVYTVDIVDYDKVVCPHCAHTMTNRPSGVNSMSVVAAAMQHFRLGSGCDYTRGGKHYPAKVFDRKAFIQFGNLPIVSIQDARPHTPYTCRTETVAEGVAKLLAHELVLQNNRHAETMARLPKSPDADMKAKIGFLTQEKACIKAELLKAHRDYAAAVTECATARKGLQEANTELTSAKKMIADATDRITGLKKRSREVIDVIGASMEEIAKQSKVQADAVDAINKTILNNY